MNEFIHVIQNNRAEWIFAVNDGSPVAQAHGPYPNRGAAITAAQAAYPGASITSDGVTEGTSQVHTPLPTVDAAAEAQRSGVEFVA